MLGLDAAPMLEPQQFDFIRALLFRVCGIKLNEHKEELVRSRLLRRLRVLGLGSFKEYLARLEADRTGEEQTLLVDALTTNTTQFFRENHHFELLRRELLPAWQRTIPAFRCWSAGCSTGQEPYSLAMTLRDHAPNTPSWNARILATDISTRVLEEARKGNYADETLGGVGEARLAKHFGAPNGAGVRRVKDDVRALISFARLNLLARWPMRGPFHAIFCRNVMIYFERPLQVQLVKRFVELLAPDGVLFIGHSESVQPGTVPLRAIGPTVYRKVA